MFIFVDPNSPLSPDLGSRAVNGNCALCAVHCALCTARCSLCAVHCTLCAVHCALCTVHCTLYTVCCSLFTVHCALFTISAQCTEYTSGKSRTLQIVAVQCSVITAVDLKRNCFIDLPSQWIPWAGTSLCSPRAKLTIIGPSGLARCGFSRYKIHWQEVMASHGECSWQIPI